MIVYYPCSGYDGSAIKLFGKQSSVFLYCDKGYSKENINRELKKHPFYGYSKARVLDKNEHINKLDGFDCHVVTHQFKRKRGFSGSHGPKNFFVVFINGDAIEAFDMLLEKFSKEMFSLVYIRPDFNRWGYDYKFTEKLQQQIKANKARIKFIAHDWCMSEELENNIADLPEIRALYSNVTETVSCNTTEEDDLEITIRKKPNNNLISN